MSETERPPEAVPLTDEALVIRFGVRDPERLGRAARECNRTLGFFGLSFWGDDYMSPEEIALQAERPNSKMRISTVGKFRRAGFELKRAGRFPHLTLNLDTDPSAEVLQKIEDLFDEPVANPHPSTGRTER